MQRNLFAFEHCVGYFAKKTIEQEQTSKLNYSYSFTIDYG